MYIFSKIVGPLNKEFQTLFLRRPKLQTKLLSVSVAEWKNGQKAIKSVTKLIFILSLSSSYEVTEPVLEMLPRLETKIFVVSAVDGPFQNWLLLREMEIHIYEV